MFFSLSKFKKNNIIMKNLAKQLLNEENSITRNKLKALIQKLVFTTISKAKKDTNLSYLGSVNSSAKILKIKH